MARTRRIVQDDAKLADILALGLKHGADPLFYVVSGETGEYEGAFRLGELGELTARRIQEDPPVRDLLADARLTFAIEKDGGFDAGILTQVFLKEDGMLEMPVVDPKGALVAIICREKWFSHVYFPLENQSGRSPVNAYSFAIAGPPCAKGPGAYAKNVHSQYGEDGIIERILCLIGQKNKFAVEFGGWDGVYLSNARNLIVNHGYRGLFIEGDPKKAETGRLNYAGNRGVKFVTGYVGFDRHRKLDSYLEEAGAPRDFDFLSIDIDGYDYQVWESLENFAPRIVCVEFNPTIPGHIVFVNPRSEELRYGSSAAALVALGHVKGYELAAVTNCNCIFVRGEEFHKLGAFGNRLGELIWRDPRRMVSCWTTYDQQLYYKGVQNYIWGGRRPLTLHDAKWGE